MAEEMMQVLAINPGSTSTKIAVFEEDRQLFAETVRHPEDELSPFRYKPVLAQLEFRVSQLLAVLRKRQIDPDSLAAVVGRGGLLKPVASGTYRVDARMLDDLRQAKRGEHAANLGAFLAQRLTEGTNKPAFIVDPVSVDEWSEVARLSGLAGLDRECLSHALNTKAICRRYSEQIGMSYADLRLIVAHLGSGFSVSAHARGRMIDVTNSMQEGAFSTERTGSLPVMALVDLCYAGKYTHAEMRANIFSAGGLASYLGSNDFNELLARISKNDNRAQLVFRALHYQLAKEIGAMATVLDGRVDAILLTGGLAHSSELIQALRKHVDWIARVAVFAGEDELRALAEGALRVLHQREEERIYA
jgi:butyrate kinase